jgi:spore germination protein GerM
VTPRQADAITVIGLAGLVATVSFTAPRWSAWLRAPAAVAEPEEAAPEGGPVETEPAASTAPDPERHISVRLYFEAKEHDGLLPEERDIAFSPDLARQIRTVVEELAKGPSGDLVATLPPGTRVQEVFVQAHGVATVSLSGEIAAGLPGGSRAELLTVYSIVNTIAANFPGVSRVQLVVDDQITRTLGGHVDLTHPLPPDMTMIALDALVPSPTPASSPAPPAQEPSTH